MFSIVVPVFNEDESLQELLTSIEQANAKFPHSYELVFVDDGSTDGTFDRLKSVSETHDHVRVFSFRRNLGKSPALCAASTRREDSTILTMDADLQDDPGSLPRMFDQLIAEGVDIVSGWRRERHDNALKIAFSRLFNRLMIRMLFRSSFKDMNSGLKLYKAEVARESASLRRHAPLHSSDRDQRWATGLLSAR